MPELIKDDSTPERIILLCECGSGVQCPNNGLGRAVAASWRTQHQSEDVADHG